MIVQSGISIEYIELEINLHSHGPGHDRDLLYLMLIVREGNELKNQAWQRASVLLFIRVYLLHVPQHLFQLSADAVYPVSLLGGPVYGHSQNRDAIPDKGFQGLVGGVIQIGALGDTGCHSLFLSVSKNGGQIGD